MWFLFRVSALRVTALMLCAQTYPNKKKGQRVNANVYISRTA